MKIYAKFHWIISTYSKIAFFYTTGQTAQSIGNVIHFALWSYDIYLFLKRVPHSVWSSASLFNFQYPLFSLRSSISSVCLPPRLPVVYILPSSFFSIMRCRRRFLCKMLSIQLTFVFIYGLWDFFSSLLFVTLLHFSHDRSNWSSPFFSTTTIQNFPGISDLLSEVSNSQHHTNAILKM
jgi:hypothetical protein